MTDTAISKLRPGRSPKVILAVVGYSVFVAADDLTVVSTMLRPIIGDLGLRLPDGLDDAAWVVNAYLIAFVAVMPLAGRLSDVIGRRLTFVAAYLIFLLGSIVIPLSTSFDEPFGVFLFGRVLTAIGGGAMVPVALAVVGDVYPVRDRARALGTLGAIETMGWVWGPLYGAMLVRFLSWEWQFWLNVPLAAIGLTASWWALEGHDRPAVRRSIDWLGAVLLTTTLVSLNVALLGSAEIQSVSGLQDLTGGGTDTRWLYGVAAVGLVAFVWHQRRADDPLLSPDLFRGRNLQVALAVNFIVGAALVITMVDVPLFVNAIEVDLEDSAVIAGWIMSALTIAMAIASYLGGRITERTWYRPPILVGIALSTAAFAWMGATWNADTSYAVVRHSARHVGCRFRTHRRTNHQRRGERCPSRSTRRSGWHRDGDTPARLQCRAVGPHRVGAEPLQRVAFDDRTATDWQPHLSRRTPRRSRAAHRASHRRDVHGSSRGRRDRSCHHLRHATTYRRRHD